MADRLHPLDLRTIVAAVSWLTHFRNPKDALNCADEILAELERTAKPERHSVRVPGALVTDGPEPPNDAPGSGWIARITQARVEARAEGARDERERIIALLDSDDSVEVQTFDFGQPVGRLRGNYLRTYLEPKP